MKDPNSKNKFDNSTGKGWSPPSGKQNPPAAGAHKSESVQRIKGDEGGGQSAGVHSSLRGNPSKQ